MKWSYRTDMTGTGPSVTIYVDEYGDRGFSSKSSEYFCVTAILVPRESHRHMRAVVGGMRTVINTQRPLHWVDHFTAKQQDRRDMASRLCASIPGLVVVHTLAHKKTLISSDALKSDNTLFYHYATKLTLERAAFACQNWEGGSRLGRVVLAAIKGTIPSDTEAYYTRFQSGIRTRAPVDWLTPNVKVTTPETEDGLQLADLYQGMFATALNGTEADDKCGRHLIDVKHQVRRNPGGYAVGWGLKLYPESLIRQLICKAWWPSWGKI